MALISQRGSSPPIAIVGAGLAGASVAWHLAPRHPVLVLDQAAQPGAEASSQNAGMVRTLGEDPYERALAIRTRAWMADPPPEFRHVSRRTGAVMGLARDETWLSDGVAHLRAAGVPVEPLDALAPVAPALAGSPLSRAWYLPEARVADASALVRGFLDGATRQGARVQCNAAVQQLVVEGGRVVGLQTAAGPIHTDLVVLAGGAWSSQLVRPLGLHRPLFPLRRTVLQTAPHPLSAVDHPWVWIDDVGVYARPHGEGWLCSGCDETHDPPPAGPGSRGAIAPVHTALGTEKLSRFIPALAPPRIQSGWTGLRTFAPDRRPVLGADPDVEGLWWAAGLGGFGVSTCKAVGEAVSGWIEGAELDWIHPRGVSAGREFPRRWSVRPTGDVARSHLLDTGS